MQSPNKHDRKFGVELELSRPLMNLFDNERDKNERWQLLTSDVTRLIQAGKLTGPNEAKWRLLTDSSCGGEIVSPPLTKNSGGFSEVATVCDLVNLMSFQAGLPASDGECGLHVHLDAADMKPRIIGSIFSILYQIEPVIYSIYTNRNHHYCAPIQVNMALMPNAKSWTEVRDFWYRPSNNRKGSGYTVDFINSDTPGDRYDETRYHGFNIHCYWRQGTIEFRYARGTFDVEKVYAFYDLCTSIVDAAISRKKIPTFEKMKKFEDMVAETTNAYRFRSNFLKMCKSLDLSKETTSALWRIAKANNAQNIVGKDPSKTKTYICESNKNKFIFSTIWGNFDIYGKILENTSIIQSTGRTVVSLMPEINQETGDKSFKVGAKNIELCLPLVIPDKVKEKLDAWKGLGAFSGNDKIKFLG